MAITILATGDIHIGKKSSSITINAEESATKYTWNKIIEYAITHQINILALTGDIVDQDNRYFESIGPLQSGFNKLKKNGIEVYLVAGNHDYEVLPQLINSERYDNVHLLGANGTWEIKRFSKNDKEMQFVGWSFPTKHINTNPFQNFDKSKIDSNVTTIGLVHGDVNMPKSNYAPIDINSFSNTAVDAWILGHIHKPQILKASDPIVYYPGSPHALSAKEQGIHGPILLTIYSKKDIQIEKIPLSPVRYESLTIDITGKTDKEKLRDTLTSKLWEDAHSKIIDLENISFLVYDIILKGRHSKINDVEQWVQPMVADYNQEIDETETQISVRKIQVEVIPEVDNLETLAKESSPAGVLAKSIIAIQNEENTNFTEQLLEKWHLLHDSIANTGTYQALQTQEKFQLHDNQEAKQYILNECMRILSELMNQKKD